MSALGGRRIVVTRRAGQASTLVQLLAERGATVIEVPAIEIAAPADVAPLDEALLALERYGWVVFTSANAVNAVLGRIAVLGLAPRLGARGPRLASLGPATTAALRSAFPADRVALEPAADFRAKGLVAAFAAQGKVAARVLLPSSSRGREELAAGLRALGAHVDAVVAYETVEPADLRERVQACLAERFDLLAFASPSAVDGFVGAAGEQARGLPAVAIGPTTAIAARAAGLDVRAVAQPSTVEALVAAAESALRGR
jgi:uroporphyrinogen III methyltransferase/synthase